MTKLQGRTILGGLLFSIFGAITPISYQQEAVASIYADYAKSVQAGDFTPGQLEKHYLKHGYQFGGITKEQYLQGAQELLDDAPGGDVLEKIRFNGDIEHFRVSTGEFAVMTKRGRIRTYFKTNYMYWLSRQ